MDTITTITILTYPAVSAAPVSWSEMAHDYHAANVPMMIVRDSWGWSPPRSSRTIEIPAAALAGIEVWRLAGPAGSGHMHREEATTGAIVDRASPLPAADPLLCAWVAQISQALWDADLARERAARIAA